MFVLFLFAITVVISLHSMDEPSLPTQLAQISSFKEFNNFCEHTKYTQNEITYAANSKILAYCVQKFLPQDVIQNNIIPLFSKSLAKKYRYRALSAKCHANAFTVEETSNSNRSFIINHDGTYTIAPYMCDKYITWKDSLLHHTYYIQHNESYTGILLSNPENNPSYALNFNGNDRTYYLEVVNHIFNKHKIQLSSPDNNEPEEGHIFSNDNSLLLYGYWYDLILYDLAEARNGVIHTSYPTFTGPIRAICAAHKSPLFVVANYNFNPRSPTLCFIEKNALHYASTYMKYMPSAQIQHIQFNTDDSQLLIHLWDNTLGNSIFQLWDTSDHTNPKKISEYIHYDIIQKTFFINDKDTIITIRRNDTFDIINLIQPVMNTHYKHKVADEISSIYHSFILYNKKNNLLINATVNNVHFFLPEKNKRCITLSIPEKQADITGIGSTTDKTIIVENQYNKKIYQFRPYSQQELIIIDYIKNGATMVQLYTIFALTKQHKGKANSLALINAINAYIHSSIDSEQSETNQNNNGFMNMISEFLFT